MNQIKDNETVLDTVGEVVYRLMDALYRSVYWYSYRSLGWSCTGGELS